MNEYASPLKTNYTDKYTDNPRLDVIGMITHAPERVLEIGCGTGATGMKMKQRFPGMKYVGVEVDETAAATAMLRLDKVIVGNIEQSDPGWFDIEKESFDLIICADILEHLYDPWKTLYVLRDYLMTGGNLIASIPNIQNLGIIMQLIAGNWTYAPFGLLDATHIRFFTLNEIQKLFQGTGYRIIQYTTILQRDIEQEAWPQDLDFGRMILRGVTKSEAMMLFTFQYLVMVEKHEI